MNLQLLFIQNQQMSQTRNIEPHLLTIEAIIQKSEFKSKILSNIPTDLKKLFLQQMSKQSPNRNQFRRAHVMYQGLYPNEINQKQIKNKNHVPPLPSKQLRSKSLNNSKQHSNMEATQTVQTTRTQSNINKKQMTKLKQRFSFAQEVKNNKNNLQIYNDENQNNNNTEDCRLNLIQVKNQKHDGEHHDRNFKRLKRIEIVLPGGQNCEMEIKKLPNFGAKTTTHNQHTKQHHQKPQDCKTAMKTQQKDEEQQQQNSQQPHKQASQENLGTIKNKTRAKSFLLKKRYQTLSQAVPDFVVAALRQQNKKISPIKNFNMNTCQFFEVMGQQKEEQKCRIAKLPVNIVNLKKKINYNKIRRSQESCTQEDILQPHANIMKLIQKQKSCALIRKNSQILSRQKRVQSRQKLTAVSKPRIKKIKIDQDVKGWDIVEGPQFYDEY